MSMFNPARLPAASVAKEMRDQDRARYADPDGDKILDQFYAIYVWRNDMWLLAGFGRRRRSWTRTFRRWRRRCGIVKGETMKAIPFSTARRHGAGDAPPQHYATTRPAVSPEPDIVPEPEGRPRRRRFTKAPAVPLVAEKGITKFVAVGRYGNTPNRVLGMFDVTSRREALAEAKRTFRLSRDVTV